MIYIFKPQWFLRLKNIICLLCLVGLAQGCVIINENNYRTLRPEQQTQIEHFNNQLIHREWNPGTQTLVEVDGNDIFDVVRQSPFTWVRLWRPFCSAESCENLSVYAAKAEAYPGLSFMLISESYDFKSIKEKFEQSNFKGSSYVLKDAVYGHKMTPARKKFIAEMGNNQPVQPLFYDNDFFFIGDSLVFAGNSLVVHLDSLMQVSQGKTFAR
ncbi:hypothetical protein DSECCO2_543700 [anaerobic digester metagenome]|nr:hypothetical protein [Lentimicrobiaceae bacterium]